jgi:hypothetical protein
LRLIFLAALQTAFLPFSFAMADPFTGNTLQASYTISATLADQTIRSAKGDVILYLDKQGRARNYNSAEDKTGALIGIGHWVKDGNTLQRIYVFGESLAIEDLEIGGKGALIVFTKSDSGCAISVKFMDNSMVRSDVQTDYCRILPGQVDPMVSK